MIEVEGLTKEFGDMVAVNNVSFTVESGEVLGFLGPNGAGKTTTMRMLTGYLPPTRGTARIVGKDVFKDSLAVRRKIGYLPENVPLYQDMSVSAYLNFVARVKDTDNRTRNDVIEEILLNCGIREVRDKTIGKLSKGFKQRVGLAQALIGSPMVLILDEPTTGLDPRQIAQIRDLIKQLASGHTIILCTHILPEVSMVCDRVVIIHNGEIVAQDSVKNLTKELTKTQMTYLTVHGPSKLVKESLKTVEGVLVVESHPGENTTDDINNYIVHARLDRDIRQVLAKSVVNAGFGLLELKSHALSLEDIFLQLTPKSGSKTGLH
ncbi:ABC transporter ATP-binding protein [bacterium]|nr:ABC transporter ATP-binding protein [bacterium]MBU1025090.1 ABC transporter ATP-binding protein [bacterium]